MTVGGLWLRGIGVATRREFGRGSPKRIGWLLAAAILFGVVVMAALGVSRTGVLLRFDSLPPPFLGVFVAVFSISFLIAFSEFGGLLSRCITYRALVGFHAFRILAELLIYQAVKEGIAPVQMSFEGYNFDIITGVSALIMIAVLWKRELRGLILAWNIMGLGLVLTVASIGALSMPGPLRAFMNEPSNQWVATYPYILLPAVMVVGAITGHLIIFRKLFASRRAP